MGGHHQPMQAVIHTCAFRGIDTVPVSVQVHLSNGLPAMMIVGLADKAVAESKERIRAALSSMGLALPAKRISINLAPADVTKEGAHFDLPIACGLLAAMGVVPSDAFDDALILGELSLDGRLAPVAGILSAALYASSQNLSLICPQENGTEARWAGADLTILPTPSLMALMHHIKGLDWIAPPAEMPQITMPRYPDMADVRGQETAKRAIEIAAAGQHHLLMIGPPGAGKSMLASRLPGLLAPLRAEESLEVTMIHSMAGLTSHGHDDDQRLILARPYRDPHHSASMPALVGGGARAKPGEISLAHHGVLFLDELPEFNRTALDSLRQPLETGEVIIARANHHIRYPAKFQLVAAMNPCRCGYLSDPQHACSRAPECGKTYMARLSGPLLDRFDIIIDVTALPAHHLLSDDRAESYDVIAARIRASQDFADKEVDEVDDPIKWLSNEARAFLETHIDNLDISARGYGKILRTARTIANLDHSKEIERAHLSEAIAYRKIRLLS